MRNSPESFVLGVEKTPELPRTLAVFLGIFVLMPFICQGVQQHLTKVTDSILSGLNDKLFEASRFAER